jgi:hypothetical protein
VRPEAPLRHNLNRKLVILFWSYLQRGLSCKKYLPRNSKLNASL